MRRLTLLAVLACSLILSACSGIPVPADKANYVGQWKGVGMDLTITPDGGVAYKRVGGSGSVSVTAPLQDFIGDDFVAGIWIMTTRFKVDRPPYQDEGVWKMVVEGVELTRVRAARPRSGEQRAGAARRTLAV